MNKITVGWTSIAIAVMIAMGMPSGIAQLVPVLVGLAISIWMLGQIAYVQIGPLKYGRKDLAPPASPDQPQDSGDKLP